jgi:hypothetical protein
MVSPKDKKCELINRLTTEDKQACRHGRAMPYLCNLYGLASMTVPYQICITFQEMQYSMNISNATGSLEQVRVCFELPEAEAHDKAKTQANTSSLHYRTKKLSGKYGQFPTGEM